MKPVKSIAYLGQFATPVDAADDDYASAQYWKGRDLGATFREFHIAADGTWAATGAKDGKGGTLFSCERLGHHRNTVDLMRGVLDSHMRIVDHRR